MTTLLAIIAAGIFVTQSPPASPQGNCTSVTGTFIFAVAPPGGSCTTGLCTLGLLKGDLNGSYEFHATHAPVAAGAPASATVRFFVGEGKVRLRSPGVVTAVETGTIDLPPGQGGFASLMTWTGGPAGHSSGQLRLTGLFNPVNAGVAGDYQGNVCD